MTAMNPTLNDPQSDLAPTIPTSPPPTAKRKRSDTNEFVPISPKLSQSFKHTNGVETASHPEQSYYNLLKLLKHHDTSPAILQYPIPLSSHNSKVSNGSSSHSPTSPAISSDETISDRVHRGFYVSVEQFLEDIDRVCSHLLSQSKSNINGAQWEYAPVDLKRDSHVAEVRAFQDLAKDLARRETSGRLRTSTPQKLKEGNVPRNTLTVDGVSSDGHGEALDKEPPTSRTVLTLFGNAQGPKQLFSSLQRPPIKQERESFPRDSIPLTDALARPLLQLRENGLPNGIASTKIFSAPPEESTSRIKTNTFLDVFPPPASLPVLVPPKTPRPSNVRQNKITWGQRSSTAPKSSLIYAQQRLATGHWLGYDGVASSVEPTSPENKRKQRDRTLSTGEMGSVPSEAAVAAQAQAREEALFRSSYSSFAPSRDNTLAIYPEEVKNQVWWQRTGRTQFDQLWASNAPIDQISHESTADKEPNDEEAMFEKAVDVFDPELIKLDNEAASVSDQDKDGRELLHDISELLEIVYSYQRIRNSCLNTIARSSIGQNSPLQDLMGTPSAPSTAEVETYNALKAQLVLIISLMPPHAVAKLNGEQLEELNISPRIQLEEPTYRGVMEEDQVSRAVKAIAHSAAVGPGPLHSRPIGISTQTPNSLLSGQARTAQMANQSRSAANSQYYTGVPPSLARQSSGFSRQPLSAWQTPLQSYNSATQQRGSFTAPQGYQSQQMPRPGSTSIRPPFPATTSSRPSNGAVSNGLYGSNTSSQPLYQQRAQSNYAANNSSMHLKSPSLSQQQAAFTNAAAYGSPQPAQSQYQRPSYHLPGKSQQPTPAGPNSPGMAIGTPQSQTPAVPTASVAQEDFGPALMVKHSQSPAPPPAATMAASNVNGTPQPK